MRVINEQDVFDIIDDLRDRMTIVGYWSVIERVKALPSATCGNLEKPEISQHSEGEAEGEAADCNLDCISRQAAIDALADYIRNVDKVMGTGKLSAHDCKDAARSVLEELPSAQSERKTGKWIDCDGGIATCSVCGDRWGVYGVMNFCPNCGAKMEGES